MNNKRSPIKLINNSLKFTQVDKYAMYLLVSIIVVSFILYFPFLTFSKLYIFRDIGSDTFDSYWPTYTFLMDWIRSGGGLWSFNIGVGASLLTNSIFIFDPFNLILLLFSNKNTLVYFLPYISTIKMVCAGLLFFYYLKYISISSRISFITSLIYTFNGYIVLWGQHYQFLLLFIYIPLILLGYERIYRKKSWLMFTIAIGLTALYSYYLFYMISIFLFIYAILRYLSERKANISDILRLFFTTVSSYLLGIGLFFIMIAPTIYVTLSNPRVSIKFLGTNLFHLASPIEYLTIAARFLSNDLMGMSYNFSGFFNYYEAPQLYCSLAVILLIPQIFCLKNIRKKIVYCVTSISLLLLLLFPFGSYLFNFFSDYKFRWTFILIIFELILFAFILNDFNGVLNRPILIASFSIWVIICGFITYKNLQRIHVNLNTTLFQIIGYIIPAFIIIIFLICYFVFFMKFGHRFNEKRKFTMIFIIVCAEMVFQNYFSINTARLTLTPDYIINKQGYFDNTNDVISYLKENDKSFYRIDKSYFSRFLNDPLFQNYRGTSSYSYLNNPSYIEFLQRTGSADFTNSSSNYIRGINGRPLLESLLGVKYYIGTSEDDSPVGFELIKRFENVYLFKNKYVLPFGITYNAYMSAEDFSLLQNNSSDNLLLSAFIIDNTEILKDSTHIKKLSLQDISKSDYYPISFNEKDVSYMNIENITGSLPKRLIYTSTTNDPMIIVPIPQNISGGIMKIKCKITSSANGIGQIFWANKDGVFTEAKSNVFNISQGEQEIDLFLGSVSASFLRVDIGNQPGMNIIIENFEILYEKQDLDQLNRYVIDRTNQSLNITSFSDTCIKGNINLSDERLMFFSIPYDKGWKAYVDGHLADLIKVNFGFTGLLLQKGNHNITLVYKAPWLDVGIIITIVSACIVFIILLFPIIRSRLIKKRLKSQK